jgi:hypothetical protein
MPAFAGMTRFFGGHRPTFAALAAQLGASLIFGFSSGRIKKNYFESRTLALSTTLP